MFGGMEDRKSILWMPRWVLWVILVACVAICEAIMFTWGPSDWAVWRTVAFGAVTGAFSFLCLFASRVIIG